MTNESPQSSGFEPDVPPVVSVEPLPATSPDSQNTPLRPTNRSNKTLWIILGVVFGAIALCCLVAAAVIVMGAIKSSKENTSASAVLDKYMRAMAAKNAEEAYDLFSPRAKRQIPILKVQEMLEGNNFVIFDGYKNLSVTSLVLSAAVNTDPDVPQGNLAKVAGTISYEGGVQGSFNGLLEKVNGDWKIDSIFVTVPPNKFK
jgi:hypothetical protein